MLDVYVFLEELPEAQLDGLKRLADTGASSRVRLVTRLYGAYEGLAAIEAETFTDAESLIDQIRDLGITGLRVAFALSIIPPVPSPLHGRKQAVESVSTIKVDPAEGMRVYEVLSKLAATQGVAITTGATDIVLELGAATFEELSRTLVEDVGQITGVSEITSSLTTFSASSPTTS